MKILETVANMLIVSFFWLVCSVPILTIVPASAALYHTSHKIIFSGRGQGVARDFFICFKDNFVQGLKLNLIVLAAVFFIGVGLNTGFQIYTLSIFGLLYLILGFAITFVFAVMIIYIPAVLSRFYLSVIDTIRLAVFFAMQNVLMSILNVLLLVLLTYIVYAIPLAIFIVPALYVDFTRPNIEKRMARFIADNNLEQYEAQEEKIEEDAEEVSMSDIDDKLRSERKKRK